MPNTLFDLVKALIPLAILFAGLFWSVFSLPAAVQEKDVRRACRYGSLTGFTLLAIYVLGSTSRFSQFSLESPSYGFRLTPILIGVVIGLTFAWLVDLLKDHGVLAVVAFLSTASTAIAIYDYLLKSNFKGAIAYLALGTLFGVGARKMVLPQRGPALAGRRYALIILAIPVALLVFLLWLSQTLNYSPANAEKARPISLLENANYSQAFTRFPASDDTPLEIKGAREGMPVLVGEDFQLIQEGRSISSPLLYGGRARPTMATSYSVSSTGRYTFVALCDNYGCDDWRLIDLREQLVRSIPVGKYAYPWMAWSPNDEYAVLASGEGTLGLLLVPLSTAEIFVVEYPASFSAIGMAKAELSTISWLPNGTGFGFSFILEKYDAAIYDAFVDVESRVMRCQERQELPETGAT